MKLTQYLPVALAASLLIGCGDDPFSQYDCDYTKDKTIKTNFVIQANSLTSVDSAVELVRHARANGYDMITTPFKSHDGTTGRKLYNSPLQASILTAMANEAHAKNKRCIAFAAWVPQFNDSVAWGSKPKWRMKTRNSRGWQTDYGNGQDERFLNPAHKDAQDYQLAIINDIQKAFDIDALFLDWVRYDTVDGGIGKYSETAYNKANRNNPLDFSSFNPDISPFYHEWREDVIAAYIGRVAKLLKPSVSLNVFSLSAAWRKDVAQNPAKWEKHVAFVHFMAYADDWDYKPWWIYGGEEYFNPVYPDDAPIIYAAIDLGFPEKKTVPVLEYHWLDDYPLSYTLDILSGLKQNYPGLPMITFYHHAGNVSEVELNKAAQAVSYVY